MLNNQEESRLLDIQGSLSQYTPIEELDAYMVELKPLLPKASKVVGDLMSAILDYRFLRQNGH